MGEKQLSVLIVDDSLLVRKQLGSTLEGLGCTVVEASNGEEALGALKNARPDLILLDIVMPEQTGIEILAKIKEIDQDVKVVMVSSVGTQAHLKEAIKLGAYDFLQKPANAEALGRLIDKLSKGDEA